MFFGIFPWILSKKQVEFLQCTYYNVLGICVGVGNQKTTKHFPKKVFETYFYINEVKIYI